jgi:cytochrome c biogenesis protein CcdA
MGGRMKFSVLTIFGLFMVLVYLGMGVFILVTHTFDYIPVTFRVVFAIIMILYGIFRFVRIYYKLRDPES